MATPMLSLTGLVVIAAIAAAGLQVAGFGLIAVAVVRGTASPNRLSWLIWSIVATLAVASSWQAGATWPLACGIANALGCIAILGLSLAYGCFAWSRLDLGCLALAGLGLAAWASTADPMLGLLFFLAADLTAILPTIRGIHADPGCENALGWSIMALGGGAALVSVEAHQWAWSWSGFGQWGAAAYVALADALVVASIILMRRVRRASRAPGPTPPPAPRPTPWAP